MTAFIAPPPRILGYLRLPLRVVRRRSGRDLLSAPQCSSRWSPTTMDAWMPGLLKLVRMAVSFAVECPFCIGLNSSGWEEFLSAPELAAVQSSSLDIFSRRERVEG